MWLRRSEVAAKDDDEDDESAGDERRFRLRCLRNTLLDLRQVTPRWKHQNVRRRRRARRASPSPLRKRDECLVCSCLLSRLMSSCACAPRNSPALHLVGAQGGHRASGPRTKSLAARPCGACAPCGVFSGMSLSCSRVRPPPPTLAHGRAISTLRQVDKGRS